jgi:four helix bundle protein
MKSFEDLEVWKECTELRRTIMGICKSLPTSENFRLNNQMTRAARSVTNNIAEGYGRYHYQENIQACRISRGSINELLDDVIILRDEGLITEKQETELREKMRSCLALINGYINYLTKAKKGIVNEPDITYEDHPINN